MRTIVLLLSHLVLLAPAEEVRNAKLVSVDADLETIRDDAKRERTEKVGVYLTVELRAAPKLDGKVRVVTTFFAKKLPGDGEVRRESTRTVSFGSVDEVEFTSQTESFTYTREYDVAVRPKQKGKQKGKKKGPVRYKKVPAKGEKYSGWAVRVYRGNELIGEEASASHLKLDP